MARSRFLLLYACAWSPFAVIYAVLVVVHGHVPVLEAVITSVWSVSSAAGLGLAAWSLASRLAWPPRRPLLFYAAHAALATGYAVCWTGAIVGSLVLLAPEQALASYVRDAIGWQLLSGATLYAVIAGAVHAVRVSRRLGAQEARAAQADALRVRAELQALRAQLNPHFLFNTLHSLTGLVHSDPAAAEASLVGFARLLRYVLQLNQAASDEVALADDVAFVRDYLALEHLRLGNRLRVVEEIDPDTLDCAIPGLTLQPLVENAIRHGIAPKALGGALRLAAYFSEDQLVLEVGDDGPGADAAAALAAPGVGLRVVRQRLLTRYPEGARFDVVTAPGNGFLVRITMPVGAAARAAAPPLVVR